MKSLHTSLYFILNTRNQIFIIDIGWAVGNWPESLSYATGKPSKKNLILNALYMRSYFFLYFLAGFLSIYDLSWNILLKRNNIFGILFQWRSLCLLCTYFIFFKLGLYKLNVKISLEIKLHCLTNRTSDVQ